MRVTGPCGGPTPAARRASRLSCRRSCPSSGAARLSRSSQPIAMCGCNSTAATNRSCWASGSSSPRHAMTASPPTPPTRARCCGRFSPMARCGSRRSRAMGASSSVPTMAFSAACRRPRVSCSGRNARCRMTDSFSAMAGSSPCGRFAAGRCCTRAVCISPLESGRSKACSSTASTPRPGARSGSTTAPAISTVCIPIRPKPSAAWLRRATSLWTARTLSCRAVRRIRRALIWRRGR